jgi:hypothetical protein
MGLRKVHESVGREVLSNILIHFQVGGRNMFKLIIREVCIGKHLSDNFPVQNGLKQGDELSPLLLYLL